MKDLEKMIQGYKEGLITYEELENCYNEIWYTTGCMSFKLYRKYKDCEIKIMNKKY